MSAIDRGYIHRVFLDKKFSRNDTGGNHWIGSQIKGWRFVGSNSKAFRVFIAPDPKKGGTYSAPAHLIKVMNYQTPAEYGCFENDTEQPNVWVDIYVSTEDEIVWTPTDEESGNSVSLTEGSVFENGNVLVNDSGTTEVCANDTNRVVSEIYNYSNETVYVGTLAAVGSVNYQDKCIKIAPGEMLPWRIKLALFGRIENATTANLNLFHKKGA